MKKCTCRRKRLRLKRGKRRSTRSDVNSLNPRTRAFGCAYCEAFDWMRYIYGRKREERSRRARAHLAEGKAASGLRRCASARLGHIISQHLSACSYRRSEYINCLGNARARRHSALVLAWLLCSAPPPSNAPALRSLPTNSCKSNFNWCINNILLSILDFSIWTLPRCRS